MRALPPERSLARLVDRLRHQGPGWIWRRLKSELALPTTAPGRVLHALLRRGVALVSAPARAWRGGPAPGAADTLLAFYDLKVQPVTFDVLWFLAAADLQRRSMGLERLHVVVVPGPQGGVREEEPGYESAVDADARRWRIHNVLVAAFGCLPSCGGFTLAGTRSVAGSLRDGARHVYPVGYEPAMPHAPFPSAECVASARRARASIAVLRAPPAGLRYVERWAASRLHGRRLVTVTLRDYAYGAARNSDVAAWAAFIRELDPARFYPVLVVDTERTLDEPVEAIRGIPIFREASWNVQLRAALYERAWLNLGVNNGPMGLCWLNERARYITFKLLTPSVAQATEDFNAARGFIAGESLPFAGRYQKWVWEDDSLPVIRREFAAMAAHLEAAEPG